MFIHPDQVEPVTDAICLGGMQGPGKVKGIAPRGAGAQDLVRSRIREEALQLNPLEAPPRFGLRFGRLEIARN